MPPRSRHRWLLLGIVLLATFGIRTRLGTAPSVTLHQGFASFPAQVGKWTLASQPALSSEVVAVLQADDYMVNDYTDAQGQQAQLFVAYYRSQQAGDSMHSPKDCLPGAGWEPIRSDTVALTAAGPQATINRYLVERDGQQELVLYWYQAQEHIIASEYWGKVLLVWDAMRHGRRDGAIVRVVVAKGANEPLTLATRQALSLANPGWRALRRFLPR
ncbi:MAG: exosortase C-terminal domain/associated protein EpsI [Terriglobales bacterium]